MACRGLKSPPGSHQEPAILSNLSTSAGSAPGEEEEEEGEEVRMNLREDDNKQRRIIVSHQNSNKEKSVIRHMDVQWVLQVIVAAAVVVGLYFALGGRAKSKKRQWSDMDVKTTNKFVQEEQEAAGAYDGKLVVTKEMLREHDADSTSPWVALHGSVYDVSKFVDVHPGGRTILLFACGRDITKDFGEKHPTVKYNVILRRNHVGSYRP